MGAAKKTPVKDADGVVIGIDVTRRFPPTAWAAADRAEAVLNEINPAAFQPLPKPGEPFDAPEVPVFPGEYRAGLQFESASGDLNPQACVAGVCTPE